MPLLILTAALAGGGCSTWESLVTGADLPQAVDMAGPSRPVDLSATSGNADLDCLSTSCGGMCTDILTDPRNCGGCDKACGPAEQCQSGNCVGKSCKANADCDDQLACTVDQCTNGACYHSPINVGPNACMPGQMCDVKQGCIAGTPPVTGPGLCFMDPPNGANLAPPPPVYKGTCPTLVAYDGKAAINTIMSSGNARTFLVAVPANLDPKEKLPIIFLWHWLGGSADGFYTKGEVQTAVNTQRFLAIIPENKRVGGKSDLLWKWPFAISDTPQRIDEEVQFFDDMYACAALQFNVNKECVGSAGVSAGALFTDQLVQQRDTTLSSAISLSGGTGGLVRPWTHPKRRVPMVALWGGMKDICVVINFEQATADLEKNLIADGDFFIECEHNCGHGEPPFVAPAGLSKYAPLWGFVFDHPYWLPTGTSPYQKTGIPTSFPPWCAIGQGNAIQRTGMCPPPGC